MLLKGITNDAVSKNLQTLNVIQTNWKTVVDFFPDAKVYYYEGDIITPKKSHQNITLKNKTTAEISNADPVFSIIENHSDSGKTELVHAYALKSFNDTTMEAIFPVVKLLVSLFSASLTAMLNVASVPVTVSSLTTSSL